MRFRRINGAASVGFPEQVYTRVQNRNASTLAKGTAVCLEVSTYHDGFSVDLPATATLSLFYGILVAPIVSGGFGWSCIHGFRGADANQPNNASMYGALVQNDSGGGSDIVAGDILVPVNGQAYLNRSGASDGKSGLVMAMEAYAKGTQVVAEKKVFVRAM